MHPQLPRLAKFDPPVTVLITVAFASPVTICEDPPVLNDDELLPVFCEILVVLVTFVLLVCVTVDVLELETLAALFENAPLPLMVTSVLANAAGAATAARSAIEANPEANLTLILVFMLSPPSCPPLKCS